MSEEETMNQAACPVENIPIGVSTGVKAMGDLSAGSAQADLLPPTIIGLRMIDDEETSCQTF